MGYSDTLFVGFVNENGIISKYLLFIQRYQLKICFDCSVFDVFTCDLLNVPGIA